MTRRKEREYIFQTIFRIEFNADAEMDEQVDLYMYDVAADMGYLSDNADDTDVAADDSEDSEFNLEQVCSVHSDIDYIRTVSKDIVSKQEMIDDVIRKYCEGWSVEHMGKAELAILRLAIYEMKFVDDVPYGVAINEAVNLAKSYGDDKAPSFINGVLAKIPDNPDEWEI
jgi:N utilization substance protein B